MTFRSKLPLMLAGVIPLSAQVSATLNRLPDGSSEIRLRNDSAVSVTTLAMSVDYVNKISATPTPLVVYVDPVIDRLLPINRYVGPLATMPLSPQQKISVSPEVLVAVSTLSGRPSFSGLVIAGIFADGTTFGDTGLVARLTLRRSNMLLAVESTLGALSDAGRRNVPRSLLIGQFKTMVESLDHWYLPPEQQIGLRFYQSEIQKLINLPDGEVGAPFPPDTFVAQETAQLTRQRADLWLKGTDAITPQTTIPDERYPRRKKER